MEELEEIRLKIKKRYTIGITVTILVTLFFICLESMVFAFWLMFGFMVTRISTLKLRNNYSRVFKTVFVLKALKARFTDLKYVPDVGIPRETIARTKSMSMGDRYHSEDFISAQYKEIKFEQADVHIEEEHISTDSDGNTTTSYVTIFKGRWMIFDFNKSFKANVQVVQKWFGNSKVKTFSLFGKKEDVFQKVSMESESFNKKFDVYAQDAHEAFYILTPSLMARIEKLDAVNKGKLLLCFIDNRLHIGIYDNKDSFEPESVFKKINEEETIKRVAGDIETITQFVDELNLDNDLFKKEV